MDDATPNTESERSPTAELILERAAELFARKGFSATSIREIAEAVGVTKPTLYYHFESKEGLVRHIVKMCMDAFISSFNLVDDEQSIERALRGVMRSQMTFAVSHPAMVDLMCRLQNQAPDEIVDVDLEGAHMAAMMNFTQLFVRAIERGDLKPRDPRLLTIQFLGAQVTLLNAWLRGHLDDRDPLELGDELVDMFFDGARAPAALESP